MREKLATEQGKRIYRRHASSIEPAFGIIKSAMGLRQFLLRGISKVRIEWNLACLAYNMRRLGPCRLKGLEMHSGRSANGLSPEACCFMRIISTIGWRMMGFGHPLSAPAETSVRQAPSGRPAGL